MAVGERSGFKPVRGQHDAARSAELFPWQPAEHVDRGRRLLADPFGPRDQLKQVPCCVSCAIVRAMEAIDAARGSAVQLSPMFHYYFARPGRRGWPWLSFLDGFRAGIDHGVAAESVYASTFLREQFDRPVPAEARDDARRRRIQPYNTYTGEESYWELTKGDRVREWKAVLDEAWPVLAGIRITDEYRRLDHEHPHASDALVVREVPSAQGGPPHAVAVLGYSDAVVDGGAFLVSDSRGAAFGDRGRWWMPYELARSRFVEEAWTLRFITYGGDD